MTFPLNAFIRFRKNPTTGDFEYKPYPSFPTWLVAWEADSGGGSSALEWQGSPIAFHNMVGDFAFDFNDQHFLGYTMSATTDGATWKQDITIAPHALGHLVAASIQQGPDCGILEMFIDDISLGTNEFYAEEIAYNNLLGLYIAVENLTVAGNHVLKAVVTGKNVESTGYKCPISYVWVRPFYELA